MGSIERRMILGVLGILIVAAMGGPTVAAAQSGPRVWVEPAEMQLPPGGTFEVQVMIERVENLGGFQLEIVYDPSVLEVTGGSIEGFLASSGRNQIPVGPQVDDEGGTVALGAFTIGDAPGAAGSGALATIKGNARREGSSALTLQDVQAMDTAAGVIPLEMEDGQVVVEEGVVAEPKPAEAAPSVRWGWIVAALVLAAAGAAALAFGFRQPKLEAGSEGESGSEDEPGSDGQADDWDV